MKKCFCFVLVAAVLFTASAQAAAGRMHRTVRKIVEEMTSCYGAYGDKEAEKVAGLLEEFSEISPAAAAKWKRIMSLWQAVSRDPDTLPDILPDGLPDTGELCLVVLGFHLNPDGSMRKELVERLKVALACARKYPRALIACTGGPTAVNNRDATEAGKMAEWLIAEGVDPARIITEDKSLTTTQNAAFTLRILSERYPRVRRLAIISSDYHVPTGELLFGAAAVLLADGDESESVAVVSGAAWHAPSGSISGRFQAAALMELLSETGN